MNTLLHLEALHKVVEEFGEVEFEVIFDNTRIQKKLVNVVKKRGKVTNKIFEYSRNLTSIQRTSDTNSLVTALIGVGKGENNTPLTFLTYEAPYDERFVKHDDYIADMEAFERFHKNNGKHIFGIFNDSEATNQVQLYENTKKKLQELSKPILTYTVDIVSLEDLIDLKFNQVEIGDYIVVKDFTFEPPILLNARVIEKQISISDPSKSKITLGDFKEAIINENQQRILQQMQKVIELKEKIWDEAHQKAEEAIEKANQSYEVAVIADGKADTAQDTADQAIVEVAKKVDTLIYNENQQATLGLIAEKANFSVVEGMLVDKVNIGDVYTKTEVDNSFNNYVSVLTFETYNEGIVTDLELLSSRVTNTELGLTSTVSRAELEAIEIGGTNVLKNSSFRGGFTGYSKNGNPEIVTVTDLAGASNALYLNNSTNIITGVQILNFVNNVKDWLGKKVVF